MSTECSDVQLALQPLGRRPVVARFDAAPITSDGGAVLLREVDRRIDLLGRLAGGFVDHRDPGRIQHSLVELVSQRVLGLALGYEDLNDHDRLREDALLGVVVGRTDPARALAGKSTLNRLELTPADADASHRYKKVVAQPAALDDLLVTLFLEAHPTPPSQIWLDLDATGSRKGGSSTATTATTATCPCTSSPASICCVRGCGRPTSTPPPGRSMSSSASSVRSARSGRRCRS